MGLASYFEDINERGWKSYESIVESDWETLRQLLLEKESRSRKLEDLSPPIFAPKWFIRTKSSIYSGDSIKIPVGEIEGTKLEVYPPLDNRISILCDRKLIASASSTGEKVKVDISDYLSEGEEVIFQIRQDGKEITFKVIPVERRSEFRSFEVEALVETLHEIQKWEEIKSIIKSETPDNLHFQTLHARIQSVKDKERRRFLKGIYFYLRGQPKDAIKELAKFSDPISKLYHALSCFQLGEWNNTIKNSDFVISSYVAELSSVYNLAFLVKIASICLDLKDLEYYPSPSLNGVKKSNGKQLVIRKDDWIYIDSALYLLEGNVRRALELVELVNDYRDLRAILIRLKGYYRERDRNSFKKEAIKLMEQDDSYRSWLEPYLYRGAR